MVLMITSSQELDQLAQALPFQVHLDRDVAQLTYPVFIKAVQIVTTNAFGEDEDIVLLVTMTDVELADVQARRTERVLDGYNYTEADEGTNVADSGEITAATEYSGGHIVQESFIRDGDHFSRSGEAGGRDELARETAREEWWEDVHPGTANAEV